MTAILPALLLFVVGCAAPVPEPQTSTSGEKESSVIPKTLVAHDVAVELGDKPLTVPLPLGKARNEALMVARDPKRSLVLRVEGIGITQQPDVIYEVQVNGIPVGVLSFYGAEENNGRGVAGFPVDDAAAKALDNDKSELIVTFTPRGTTDENGREIITLKGRARFTRLSLAEE